ncbi:MAG TPA: hypothetical protein VJ862_02390 [Rhodanobacteraceae bacterium]|nr:hypothetical protein [Rhodanobacteraceae bacterium]
MKRILVLAAAITVGLGFGISAQAQTTPAGSAPVTTPARRPHDAATETGRDVAQQKRIEQGLQSGQLSTGEARKLEAGQARIDKTEQRDLRNGSLSASERAQIQHQQNRESVAIQKDKHNSVKGNPDSLRSNLAQADVQRNLNQQLRLHNGVKQGSLTNRELGRAEGAEARIGRMESRPDTLRRTARVQRADNRASRGIYRAKHNRRGRR